MNHDFHQIQWDEEVEADCRRLVELAVREDLDQGRDRSRDWTTEALVDPAERGAAEVVAREAGVVCGLRAAEVALEEMSKRLALGSPIAWEAVARDGDSVSAGAVLATMRGPARGLLTCERTVLNYIGRLSGVTTHTRRHVEQVAGSGAAIYDTRKTTPGWRRLEKYAVRCGGGRNHRTGLFDAVLIKDNHLASGRSGSRRFSPAEAVRLARRLVDQHGAKRAGDESRTDRKTPSGEKAHADVGARADEKARADAAAVDRMIVEIEVDTLAQLEEVLPAGPDIVLLDNMTPEALREAVALRDRLAKDVQLEASGGVTLETLAKIAATGVERISLGALTHRAMWLDVGLDFE